MIIVNNKIEDIMSERKRIYLCLAHLSDEGLEQKYIKEAFDTNWVVPLGAECEWVREGLGRVLWSE